MHILKSFKLKTVLIYLSRGFSVFIMFSFHLIKNCQNNEVMFSNHIVLQKILITFFWFFIQSKLEIFLIKQISELKFVIIA